MRTNCDRRHGPIREIGVLCCAIGLIASGPAASAAIGQELPPAEQFKPPRFASLVLTLDAGGEASIYFFFGGLYAPAGQGASSSGFPPVPRRYRGGNLRE